MRGNRLPTGGFVHTEIGVTLEQGEFHGTEKDLQPGVQARAVKLVGDRGVSVAQAARVLGIYENLPRKSTRQ